MSAEIVNKSYRGELEIKRAGLIDCLGGSCRCSPAASREVGSGVDKFCFFFLRLFLSRQKSHRSHGATVIPRAYPVTLVVCRLEKAVGNVGPEHTQVGSLLVSLLAS